MTNEEAISWLRTTMSNAEQLCECEKEAFEMAITALSNSYQPNKHKKIVSNYTDKIDIRFSNCEVEE